LEKKYVKNAEKWWKNQTNGIERGFN
jgi:hypothetical protein